MFYTVNMCFVCKSLAVQFFGRLIVFYSILILVSLDNNNNKRKTKFSNTLPWRLLHIYIDQ